MSQVLLRLTGKLVTDHTTTKAFNFSVTPSVGYHPRIVGPVRISRRISGVLNGLANLKVSDVQVNGVGVVGDWFDYAFVGTAAELDYAGTTYSLVVANTRYRDGIVTITFDDHTTVLNTDIEMTTSGDESLTAHFDADQVIPRAWGKCSHVGGVVSKKTQFGQHNDYGVSSNQNMEATAQYHGGFPLADAYVGGSYDSNRMFNFHNGLIEDQGNDWNYDGASGWTISFATGVTYTGTYEASAYNYYELDAWHADVNFRGILQPITFSVSGGTYPEVGVDWDFSAFYERAEYKNPGLAGGNLADYWYPLAALGDDHWRKNRLYLVCHWCRVSAFVEVVIELNYPCALDIQDTTAANRRASNVLADIVGEKLAGGQIGDVLDSDTADAGIYLYDRTNLLALLGEYFRCGFFYGMNRSSDFELKELDVPGTPTKTIHRAAVNSHSVEQVEELFHTVRVGYKENNRVLRPSEIYRPRNPSAGIDVVDTDYMMRRFFNYAEAASANAANFSDTAYMPEIFPSFYAASTRPQAIADRIIDLWGVPRNIHTFEVVNETLDFDIGDTIAMEGYGNNLDDDYVVWGYDVECVSDTLALGLLK